MMVIMTQFEKIYIYPSQAQVSFLSTGMHDSGVSHHLEWMEMEESSHLFKNKTLLMALQSLSDSNKKGKERKRKRVKARTFLFPFPRFDLYSGPIIR